jgi:hypothetical protein
VKASWQGYGLIGATTVCTTLLSNTAARCPPATAGGEGLTTGGKVILDVPDPSAWQRTSCMPYAGTYVKQDTATSIQLEAPEIFESKGPACRCGRQCSSGCLHRLVVAVGVDHIICAAGQVSQ